MLTMLFLTRFVVQYIKGKKISNASAQLEPKSFNAKYRLIPINVNPRQRMMSK